jgi:iron(III) transport system ATP-binding protein
MLELHNIAKTYNGVGAVRSVTLHVTRGEFVTLLGPSGCGKTTTLRMIAGFIKPDSGSITLNGRTLSDVQTGVFVPPEQRGMGMVFQSYAVWPHMTVFNNVAYPLRLQRQPREQMQRRVHNVLRLVALEGYEKRYPHQLSGGQQQRVALARALVASPQVMLLDEPLSNLDARLRDTMRYEIVDLQKRLGITVVYVTHDQAEAMAISDRIVVMRAGEVLQIDTPRVIYSRPEQRFVADFVGAANFIPCTISAHDVDRVRVRLKTGQELWVAAPHSAVVGDSAVLMTRPEQMTVVALPDAHLTATVTRIAYLGDRLEIELAADGLKLRAVTTTHDEALVPGDHIGLRLNDAVLLPESG